MDINETPAGHQMNVNIDDPIAPPPTPAPGAKFLDELPEAYRQKDWAQKLAQHENPRDEFYKQFDNQVSLIGKKAEGVKLPGEGATGDDWKNFYKSIGVPDTADGYSYQLPEVAEHLKPYVTEDTDLVNAMKAAALEAGVRPEGFKKITDAFDKYYVNLLENQIKTENETLKSVESAFAQKFGDRAQQVLNNWTESMVGIANADIVNGLHPGVKAALAEQYEAFTQKYIREDKVNLNVPNVSGSVMTQQEYSDEYGRLFAAVRNAKPGSAEQMEATKKLNDLKAKGASQIFKK